MAGWDTERPIYHRLPEKGYQDNLVADWLTAWVDSKLMTTKTTLETFYLELDPTTAKAISLDYLAALVGLSGSYWSVGWSEASKRLMIASAYWLWRNRGTLRAIRAVIAIMGLPVDLWLDGDLRLSFKLSGVFKTNKLRVYLRLPLSVPREGETWKETRRVRDNWVPAILDSKVCYQSFAMGFSRLGDPMF